MIGGGWYLCGLLWLEFWWGCGLFIGLMVFIGGVDFRVYFCEYCLDGLLLFLVGVLGVRFV